MPLVELHTRRKQHEIVIELSSAAAILTRASAVSRLIRRYSTLSLSIYIGVCNVVSGSEINLYLFLFCEIGTNFEHTSKTNKLILKYGY